MNPEQFAFLEQQFFSMALMATAQRGRLYSEDSNDSLRQAFRRDLHSELKRLTQQYRTGIPDAIHIATIAELADAMSGRHATALVGSRLRIGSAQKALNLYLKFMWCIGAIPTPPHCPFDFVVLSRIPGCQNVRWTQLDSLPEYETIVRHAKGVAGSIPLAEWELTLYNDAQPFVPGDRRQAALAGSLRASPSDGP